MKGSSTIRHTIKAPGVSAPSLPRLSTKPVTSSTQTQYQHSGKKRNSCQQKNNVCPCATDRCCPYAPSGVSLLGRAAPVPLRRAVPVPLWRAAPVPLWPVLARPHSTRSVRTRSRCCPSQSVPRFLPCCTQGAWSGKAKFSRRRGQPVQSSARRHTLPPPLMAKPGY